MVAEEKEDEFVVCFDNGNNEANKKTLMDMIAENENRELLLESYPPKPEMKGSKIISLYTALCSGIKIKDFLMKYADVNP